MSYSYEQLVIYGTYSYVRCYHWKNWMYTGSLCIIPYNCMGIYKYLKTKNYNNNIITKDLHTQHRFFFCHGRQKEILKTFSERVNTRIQHKGSKYKRSRVITSQTTRGKTLCAHTNTQNSRAYSPLFFST